jgi:alpha-beta hydrolase superfamily lysophospholipase
VAVTLRAEACFFRGADGALLHYDMLDGGPSARAICLTVHGLGEHMTKYSEWTEYALSHGYHVARYDQRGHGRTPGRRGDFEFQNLVRDLGRFVGVISDRYPDSPVFIVAHSLGALVALHYAADEAPSSVAGMVLSGPPLALAQPRPGWYRYGMNLLARMAPGLMLPRGSNPAVLTRDPERIAAMTDDPLYHKVITPRAVVGISDAMESARIFPESIDLPLLLFVAGNDTIVSGPDILAFGHSVASRDVTVEQIPGAYHEVLNDLGRVAIYDRIVKWCDERIG